MDGLAVSLEVHPLPLPSQHSLTELHWPEWREDDHRWLPAWRGDFAADGLHMATALAHDAASGRLAGAATVSERSRPCSRPGLSRGAKPLTSRKSGSQLSWWRKRCTVGAAISAAFRRAVTAAASGGGRPPGAQRAVILKSLAISRGSRPRTTRSRRISACQSERARRTCCQ